MYDDKYAVRKLMPLYLPSGWEIILNRFFDESPVIENGKLTNDYYFGKDLLGLRLNQQVFDYENNQHIEAVYNILLGWYPEFSPEGHYLLTAICNSEDIARFETRDRYQIVVVLQHWINVMMISETALHNIKYTHLLFATTDDQKTANQDGK